MIRRFYPEPPEVQAAMSVLTEGSRVDGAEMDGTESRHGSLTSIDRDDAERGGLFGITGKYRI